jgi:antitoxin Xre/MbcA/ParS-like protein
VAALDHPFLAEVVTPDGSVATDRLSHALRVTKLELARSAGLSRDAVWKSARLNARTTQARLRDVVEIIARVLPWAGSVPQAFAWYRAQPLPSFGDQTAEDLVKQGRAEAVKAYLARIAAGGYA